MPRPQPPLLQTYVATCAQARLLQFVGAPGPVQVVPQVVTLLKFVSQPFAALPSQLPKISVLRRMIDTADYPIALAVDGGVTPATAPAILAAGADTLIAGTSVFRAPDYAKAITELRGGA